MPPATRPIHFVINDLLTACAWNGLFRDDFRLRWCFYPPTVLTQVPQSAQMRHEDIFGPVSAISSFTTEDEVIGRCLGVASLATVRVLTLFGRASDAIADDGVREPAGGNARWHGGGGPGGRRLS